MSSAPTYHVSFTSYLENKVFGVGKLGCQTGLFLLFITKFRAVSPRLITYKMVIETLVTSSCIWKISCLPVSGISELFSNFFCHRLCDLHVRSDDRKPGMGVSTPTKGY